MVYKSLCNAYGRWAEGERNADNLKDAAKSVLLTESIIKSIDYVSVASMTTLDEVDLIDENAILSVAVEIGSVRLIDNMVLE